MVVPFCWEIALLNKWLCREQDSGSLSPKWWEGIPTAKSLPGGLSNYWAVKLLPLQRPEYQFRVFENILQMLALSFLPL